MDEGSLLLSLSRSGMVSVIDASQSSPRHMLGPRYVVGVNVCVHSVGIGCCETHAKLLIRVCALCALLHTPNASVL